MNTSICKLLNEIREAHSRLPNRDEFPVHIEIFSDDNIVGLHQFVGDYKNMTLVRYHHEPDSFFDIEFSILLSNYLKLLSRKD